MEQEHHMIDIKNATGVMTTVDSTSIKLFRTIGTDDIYTAKTEDNANVLCVVPGLSIAAPRDVREWMRQRVEANLTGRCPACDACVTATQNITGTIKHEDSCTISTLPAWVKKWLRK
jgi:hypothetical protein